MEALTASMAGDSNLHATVLIWEEVGIMIEGRSGAGKTSLAMALMADGEAEGRFTCLVGDDRVTVTARNGQLIARPHPAVAGLIEHRGIGLFTVPYERACVLGLAVTLVGSPVELGERCPPTRPARRFLGVDLPFMTLLASGGARENSGRIRVALSQCDGAPLMESFQSACHSFRNAQR